VNRLMMLAVFGLAVSACAGGDTSEESTTNLGSTTSTTTTSTSTTTLPVTTTTIPVTTTSCFDRGSECSDEARFLEFVRTFDYEDGGVIDGVSVTQANGSDLIAAGRDWCSALEGLAETLGESGDEVDVESAWSSTKALAMASATEGRDPTGSEVLVVIFTGAEGWLCPDVSP
jgi:hypothetical protein